MSDTSHPEHNQQPVRRSPAEEIEQLQILRLPVEQIHAETINAALRAYATLVRQTDWQPLETAPKDGRVICITNGDFVVTGYWLEDAWRIGVHATFSAEWPILWHPLSPLPSPPALLKGDPA